MSTVNQLLLKPYDFNELENIRSCIYNEKALLIWAGPKYFFPIDNSQIANRLNNGVDILTAYSVKEQKTVGFIELEKVENQEIGSIQSVLIYENYRGKKYGKELIDEIIKFGFINKKYRELRLKVFANNQIAKRCYESCGFQVFNEIEKKGNDGKVLFTLFEMKIENL